MSNKNQEKQSFSSATGAATIALETESGSRIIVNAVQPSDSAANSLRYRWQADANAVVLSPDNAVTEVLMPQVMAVTRINLTLIVTNAAGISARRSWPVLVMPSAGSDDGSQDQGDNAAYPQWSAATPYPGGSRVSHRGGNYEAKWWVTAGTEPGLVTTTGPATGNSLPWMQI